MVQTRCSCAVLFFVAGAMLSNTFPASAEEAAETAASKIAAAGTVEVEKPSAEASTVESEPAAAAAAGESFIDLFNGKDLSGWVVEGTKTFDGSDGKQPVWSVRDGVIHCAGRGFGYLRYDEKFCDFEYQVDYRLTKKCNSGIGIRSVKFTGKAESRPSFAGYEIQLIDNGARKPSTHGTGSLYRYLAPRSLPAKPAGEWNTISIECRGPHVKITLNGEVIQDVDQSTVEEIAGKPLCGYVSVQNHGGEVDFRNLRIKKLN